MKDKKLVWLGILAAVGIFTANSVEAQTNQSDASGGQTVNAPTQMIDSTNGNGVSPTSQFDPATGQVVGGKIDNPVQIDPNLADGEGLTVGCQTSSCSQTQPREVTFSQVAEVLDASLERSLDNLAAAENDAKLANAEPRRIARRSAVSDGDVKACVNPVYEARETVERQLVESQKFIQQVNEIEPQKNIW